MKNNYKNPIRASKPSDKTQPRVLARLLSVEVAKKISAGASKGDVVCKGTGKGDKVQVDCVYY